MSYNPNNPNGQTTSANSAPVVIASDQTAVPVSIASSPLPTGAATAANQVTGNSSLSSIDGKTPALVSGRVPVDGSGVTQPISGSVSVSNFPATQPVSGTVTANAGTGTFAVSAASLPLPTGASTSALQSTINTTLGSPFQAGGSIGNTSFGATQSGTWDINNVSGTVSLPTGASTSALQTTGNTSLSSIDTKLTGVTVAQGSTTSGQSGQLIQGAVTTAAPTYVTAQTSPLSLTTAGALRTDSSATTQPVSQATASSLNAQVVGNVADAATDSGNTVKVGGVFDTTLPTYTNGQRGHLELDANGRVIVTSAPLDGSKASYSMAATVTLAATATDVFTITGSASKTIRITQIQVSGIATTAISPIVVLAKRSTANTAGTSTAMTAVPHDSSSAAATATGLAYTANPTLGNLVGNIRSDRIVFPLTTVAGSGPQIWTFGERPSQAIVLRGTSQVLAVNLSSTTVTGGSISCDIEWTEE